MNTETKLKIVNEHLNYDPVSLVDASPNYYLHIAIEVDRSITPFFLWDSGKKKKVLKRAKQLCSDIAKTNKIEDANVFKAQLIPPGRGKYIKENSSQIHIAKFDVVILIEAHSKEILAQITESQAYKQAIDFFEQNGTHLHQVKARNIRRINDVDHTKQGVFLFNYFFAENTQQNLDVWNYTAGWFEQETQLDNSELMLPLDKANSDYTIINHCRWDNYRAILPSLIFKNTFRSYVLDNFYANNVGAMPILYKKY